MRTFKSYTGIWKALFIIYLLISTVLYLLLFKNYTLFNVLIGVFVIFFVIPLPFIIFLLLFPLFCFEIKLLENKFTAKTLLGKKNVFYKDIKKISISERDPYYQSRYHHMYIHTKKGIYSLYFERRIAAKLVRELRKEMKKRKRETVIEPTLIFDWHRPFSWYCREYLYN